MLQPLARKLLSLASTCQEIELWDRVPAQLTILIRIPGHGHMVAASVVGTDDDDFGFILFLGEDGAVRMARMLAGHVDVDSAYADSHVVTFRLAPSNRIVGAFRRVLKDGGHRPRAGRLTPHFMVAVRGDEWRPIKQGEARVLALCLHALLSAVDGGALDGAADEIGILALTVSSDAIESKNAPSVSWELGSAPSASSLMVRAGTCWAAHAWRAQPRGADDERELSLLAIYDVDTDVLVGTVGIHGTDVDKVEDAFMSVALTRDWQPETLLIQTAWLNAALEPMLSDTEIDAQFGPFPATLEHEFELLRRHLARRYKRSLDPNESDDDHAPGVVRPQLVIDPVSVEAWSEIVDELIDKTQLLVDPDDRRRGTRLYWGDTEAVQDLHGEIVEGSADSAFHDWLVMDHRENEASNTYIERALARPQDRAVPETAALHALSQSTLSVFDIVATGGGGIHLEDLATGERSVAYCSELHEALPEFTCIPLRVLELRGHTICRIAGPTLDQSIIERLYKRDTGILASLEGGSLREEGPTLGSLWRRFDGTFVAEEASGATDS